MSSSAASREGYLQKKGKILKRWVRRYYLLDGNSLSYGAEKEGRMKVIHINPGTREVQFIDKDGRYGFKFHGDDGPHVLYAKSLQERDMWANAIRGVTPQALPAVRSEPALPPPSNVVKPISGMLPAAAPPLPKLPTSGPNIKKIPSIADKYETKEKLGSGGFATVSVVLEIETRREYAMKQIKAKTVEENKLHIMQEISIMEVLHHPNIVKLHEVLETPTDLCIMMELMRGGELFDRILQKGAYSEADASSVLRKMIGALAYLHERNICHCDLKPENLIYASTAPDAELKIIDFGLSVFCDSPQAKNVTKIVGTPEYIAPEVILRKGYGPSVDMWSIGVIAYILLCGYYPFFGDSIQDIFQAVYKGKFDFPAEEWDTISDQAKDLIRHLLLVDPTERWTAKRALQHPWLQVASDQPINSRVLDNIKSLQAKARLRKGATAVRAAIRLISSQKAGSGRGAGGLAAAFAAAAAKKDSDPASPAGAPAPAPPPRASTPTAAPTKHLRPNSPDARIAIRQKSMGKMAVNMEQLKLNFDEDE